MRRHRHHRHHQPSHTFLPSSIIITGCCIYTVRLHLGSSVVYLSPYAEDTQVTNIVVYLSPYAEDAQVLQKLYS